MFGNNPIRKPLKGDGSTLEVKEIFPTLQGEGPLAGMPSVFIRLGGCNLACSFCDTDFEDYRNMSTSDVVTQAKELALEEGKFVRKLTVITGGEPFRQPIEKLCDGLLAAGFDVQIETNGTLYRPLDERVQIVCSPKNVSGKYARIHEDLLQRLTALKFLISAHDKAYGEVPEVGQTEYNIPVFIQPLDEQDTKKNEENILLAQKLAFQHGHRLSLQLHKILGIR